MREVIGTVYELADLGVTIVPVKSQTGPVNTAMGRLLWAIQAWYGEMENEERSENVRLGQARARAQGKEIGRPREVANDVQERILTLRVEGYGYKAISQATGMPRSTVRRILKGAETMPKIERANPAVSVPAEAIP
jgi:putative DNA-invertase from lambdoid prophage Rac